MELFGTKIINLPNEVINISGEWLENKTKKWEGQIFSEKPVSTISFLEINNRIKWIKSKKSNENIQKMEINLFHYDNSGLDIQFNYDINGGGAYYRSKIETVDYLPDIITENIKSCVISLICSFDGIPKIKLYAAFLPTIIIQIGRNGIWHIKNGYNEFIKPEFINILNYGRQGYIENFIK